MSGVTGAAPADPGGVYEIRVSPPVDERLAVEFLPLQVRDGTVLFGHLPDQAALHGVLDRLRDHRLVLLELRKLMVS